MKAVVAVAEVIQDLALHLAHRSCDLDSYLITNLKIGFS